MFYSVNSSGLLGLSAYPVRAEVDFSQSMPAFEIVGLPGTAVKESRDRVRSAIRNCGFAFPVGKIIVISLPRRREEGWRTVRFAHFPRRTQGGRYAGRRPCRQRFFRRTVFIRRGAADQRRAAAGAGRPKTGAAPGFPPAGQRFRGGAGSRNRGIWPISRQTAAGLVSKGEALSPAVSSTALPSENLPDLDFADVKGQAARQTSAGGGRGRRAQFIDDRLSRRRQIHAGQTVCLPSCRK